MIKKNRNWDLAEPYERLKYALELHIKDFKCFQNKELVARLVQEQGTNENLVNILGSLYREVQKTVGLPFKEDLILPYYLMSIPNDFSPVIIDLGTLNKKPVLVTANMINDRRFPNYLYTTGEGYHLKGKFIYNKVDKLRLVIYNTDDTSQRVIVSFDMDIFADSLLFAVDTNEYPWFYEKAAEIFQDTRYTWLTMFN